MADADDLVGVKEAARIMGWDQRKFSVYLGRGIVPRPMTRLAATPVWKREDIERFARQQGGQEGPTWHRDEGKGEDNPEHTIPEEHIRAILWAHFESARVGLLRPPFYGDPLPWTINEKPPGYARALPGMRFPVVYNELWPKFLELMLGRPDLDELLARPDQMWGIAHDIFEQIRAVWEREQLKEKADSHQAASDGKEEEAMTVSEAVYILRLPRHLNGEPDYYFLEGRRKERLAQAKTKEQRCQIQRAYRTLKQAQLEERRKR